jgi:hypothetical protein
LIFPEGIHGNVIGGDAANVPIEDGFTTTCRYTVLLNTSNKIRTSGLSEKQAGFSGREENFA